MANEKMKEIREWLNLIMTALTVILLPVAVVVLKNQRLEMQKENAATFLPKTSFYEYRDEHRSLEDRERTRQDAKIVAQEIQSQKVEAKIDGLSSKVDAITINLTTVQAELRMLNRIKDASP